MTGNAHEIAQQIKVAARVCELRRLAEATTRACDEAVAASGLPLEHFRLRAVIFSMLAPAPRK